MFIRNHRLRRLIASGLLIELLTQFAWPTVSYALTAGPTAPEATSFEPVDTTDMVNMLSGDMTYNIPLLEVPGPEGGYPLSLAYHAGVGPEVEASWVGLGWSLNPGAITRNVNGYADDYKDINQVTRDYWTGGAMTTTRVGLAAGIPGNVASVSAGLSFSHDTYKGFATGSYCGIGIHLGGDNSPVGISAGLSTNGYGSSSASAGIGASTHSAVALGGHIGIATNFSSVTATTGAGISAGHNSLLGASMSSSNSGGTSIRGTGPGGASNDKAGSIQTDSRDFSLDIPVLPGVFLEYGYAYTRYWSDETAVVNTNGALYYPVAPSVADVTNNAYDTYRLLDLTQDIVTNPDPDKVMGGSFAEYDNYSVTAQGLSGSFRPYSFQQPLYSRNRLDQDGNVMVQDLPLATNVASNKPGFRFENDFSNQYRQENGSMSSGYSGTSYSFDVAPSHGDNTGMGWDNNTGKLAGSKHIDWYTNEDILSKTASGLIDTDALGFIRQSDKQIGGFSITNASGVTYHYALPAYSSNEIVYSELLNKEDGTPYPEGFKYSKLKKSARYAYTWYLTAVTGPDYVDRNANMLPDANDWGYWVKFNYGQWSDRAGWRNPATGYLKDIDSNVRMFSKGIKEVYYLNSITTRTHTAIFEKELRQDAISSTLDQRDQLAKILSPEDGFSHWNGSLSNPIGNNTGFSTATTVDSTYSSYYHPQNIPDHWVRDLYIVTKTKTPCKSLRLANIYLLNNKDLPDNLNNASADYNIDNATPPPFTTETASTPQPQAYPYQIKRYNISYQRQSGQNVIDKADLDYGGLRELLTSKALRVISFKHDYSLAPYTPNTSYSSGNTPNFGKLTLKALSFLGVAGTSAMPATTFSYELGAGEAKNMVFTFSSLDAYNRVGEIAIQSGDSPLVGDLLLYDPVGPDNTARYCVILSNNTASGSYSVRMIGNLTPTSSGQFNAVTTKNPPYSAENRDWWGMYKSDFDPNLTGVSESVSRRTTAVSDKSVDVWSLRTISSPLGSKINVIYEGDQYRKPVLYRPDMFLKIAQEQPTHANNTGNALSLKTPFSLKQEQALLKAGDELRFTGIVGTVTKITAYTNANTNPNGPPVPLPSAWEYSYSFVLDAKVNVQNLQDHEIDINDLDGRLNTNTCATWNGSCSGYTYSNFIADGYISFPKRDQLQYGGGLRVASVNVTASNETRKTLYKYDNLVSSDLYATALPSGVTSYEPGSIFKIDDANSQRLGDVPLTLRNQYKIAYMNSLPALLAVAREVPAPGVMYEGVRVQESLVRDGQPEQAVPGFWTYRFTVFDPAMIKVNQDAIVTANNNLLTRRVAIKDMTSRIGSMRSVTHWASPGRKLTETNNHYLHDDLSYGPNDATSQGAANYQNQLAVFNYQGLIQESFGDSRKVTSDDKSSTVQQVVLSKRDVYPTVLTSTTSTDYVSGKTSTNQTLAFDFFSGTAIKTVAADGYGNRFMTEVVPAYRRYPAMGLKLSSAANHNMLTQVAATTISKVDNSNTAVGVLAANAQTWSNQVPVIGLASDNAESISTQASTSTGDVWRPWQSYSWLPTGATTSGLTPLAGFTPYNFNNAPAAASWKQTGQVTLYNPYSNALEAKDINGTYLTTKLGFNQSKVLVSGGPAAYQELAYSGAEESGKQMGDYFSGAVAVTWTPGSGSDPGGPWGTGNVEVSKMMAHTGTSSLRVGSFKNGFSYVPNVSASDPNKFYLDPTKPYRMSVWANDAAGYLYYVLDGQETGVTGTSQKRTANGWYLLELVLPPIGTGHTNFRVSCYNSNPNASVYFDDFRFAPLNAQATSYVYDPLSGQVTDILNNSNLATHYDYSTDGSLKRVSRETFQNGVKKVAEYSRYIPGAIRGTTVTTSGGKITVNVPDAAGPVQVYYDLFDGSGYQLLSTTAGQPYSFNDPGQNGPFWVRVRVTDGLNQVFELAKRIR